MTDRIEAIRARWEKATPLGWPWDDDTVYLASQDPRKVHAIANAPEDIAYLLDAYRHMVESWQTIEEMADDIGPLDHGAACASHWGKPCDCAWAQLRATLNTSSAEESP